VVELKVEVLDVTVGLDVIELEVVVLELEVDVLELGVDVDVVGVGVPLQTTFHSQSHFKVLLLKSFGQRHHRVYMTPLSHSKYSRQTTRWGCRIFSSLRPQYGVRWELLLEGALQLVLKTEEHLKVSGFIL
jgi:hypothetical protein